MGLAIERTQVIQLEKGWNAIYLEVTPKIETQNISTFVQSTIAQNSTIPIEMITAYFPLNSSIAYIDSPDEEIWKKAGWKTWIRDDLEESFLTNLYSLEAGKAYLIRSSKSFVWTISGEVEKIRTVWQPNNFTFTGFQVGDEDVSFYTLFEDTALKNTVVYGLQEGKWEKLSLLDEAIAKGKAYWIFNTGIDNFQGTVELDLDDGASSLNYLDIVQTKTISLFNKTNQPKTVSLSLENNTVPLSLISKNALYENIYTPVISDIQTFTIPANSEAFVKLGIRRSEISDNKERQGILKMEIQETGEIQRLAISAYGDIQ
jgi:hypothetical protein